MCVVIGAPIVPLLCVYVRTDDVKVCLMKDFRFEVRVVNYITLWLLLKLKSVFGFGFVNVFDRITEL